jgi:hypothetical protein
VNERERLSRLREEGAAARERAAGALAAADSAACEAAGKAVSSLDQATRSLKWGAGLLLSCAVLFRVVKFRKGYRTLRWLWNLTPALARFAVPRLVAARRRRGRSHLFGRRDSK